MAELNNVRSSVKVSPVSANSEPQNYQTSQEYSQQKCRHNFCRYTLRWNPLMILLSGWIYPYCTVHFVETMPRKHTVPYVHNTKQTVSTNALLSYSSNAHVVTHSKSNKSCITFQSIMTQVHLPILI